MSSFSPSPPPRTVVYGTDGVNSPQTRKKYAYYFNQFMKHFDIADKEALLDLGKDPRLTEGYIIRYIKYLAEERHLVYSSIYNQTAALLHFFEMNDVLLNKRKIHKFIPPDESAHDEDRPYTICRISKIKCRLFRCCSHTSRPLRGYCQRHQFLKC
jgi:hypothetical protein